MTPRRRSKSKHGWPRNLYEHEGYFSWRHPISGEHFGLGRDKRYAFDQAIEANLHIAGNLQRDRLVDRLSGDKKRTVETWLEKYADALAQRKLAANTLKSYRSLAKRAAVMLGADTKVKAVTALQVSEALEQVAAEHPRTAQALRSFLFDCFRLAVVKGWRDDNPVRDVGGGSVEVNRARLSLETFRVLYQKTDVVWLKNAMALALVSAQRREDIAVAQFADIREGAWWVEQGKTGARIILPLELRLEALGLSLEDVVRQCRTTGVLSPHLIHQTQRFGNSPLGRRIWKDTISRRFTDELATLRLDFSDKDPPTFHEIRSLAERLYNAQGGVDTQALLGHKDARSTQLYHDARGAWVRLKVGTV